MIDQDVRVGPKSGPKEIWKARDAVGVNARQDGQQAFKLLGFDAQVTPADIFLQLYPLTMRTQARYINETAKQHGKKWKNVTEGEMLVWMGLFIGAAQLKCSSQDSLWKTEPDGFRQAPNFGRFLPRDRFKAIKRHFSVTDAPSSGNPWWRV
jgi:hypothetical protein